MDVHCHNDVGLALSNALSGCEGGADQIHTTIDGLGERTGIPTLAEIAVALSLIYKSNNSFRLHLLKDLSRTISDYTRIPVHESKPLVGDSAYKHKAGTHLAAILRNPSAYEIIEPKQVGNRRKNSIWRVCQERMVLPTYCPFWVWILTKKMPSPWQRD